MIVAATIAIRDTARQMKDTPLIDVVRSWVDPGRGKPYLDWLKHKHMAEAVAEPGIPWARRVMLDQPDDEG